MLQSDRTFTISIAIMASTFVLIVNQGSEYVIRVLSKPDSDISTPLNISVVSLVVIFYIIYLNKDDKKFKIFISIDKIMKMGMMGFVLIMIELLVFLIILDGKLPPFIK